MAATPCIDCPLRALPLFIAHSEDELALVQYLKRREITLDAGATLIHEGQSDTRLFTLLEGWAYRFKTLSDGRRQILNFLLAGDFIGVQQKMSDSAAHGVVAITAARLCVFDRDALWELHRQQPSMGFNVTWLTAHEESLVDDNLLSLGRRSAEERVATALILLYKRAAALRGMPSISMAAGVPSISTARGMPSISTARGMPSVSTARGMPSVSTAGALPPHAPGHDGEQATAAAALPPTDGGEGVPFPLTQQHLADALGLSLAHTNKTLRKLERAGLYRIENARLILRDPKALVRLADLYGDGKPSPRPLV